MTFKWYSHVGADIRRYRATIVAGSAAQVYGGNYIHNPSNDYEMTSANRSM